MAQLAILEYPDPRLREISEPVTTFDAELAQIAADLTETLHASTGIGLSAPQANVFRRILVMDLSDDDSDPQVFINPQILWKLAPGLVEESCLSVPGVVGNVIRSTQIRVSAQDISGETFERDLEGMYAVCLQHEMDHLAGKLFIDRLSLFRRLKLRATAAKKARKNVTA